MDDRFFSIEQRYKQIENSFISTRFFVDWTKDNLSTTSQAFEDLLLKIGDEFESYITEYVLLFNKKNKGYINVFFECVDKKCHCLFYRGVKILHTNMIIFPFLFLKTKGNGTKATSPDWWNKYNKLKHKRLDANNQNSISLKDVFEALSSLSLVKVCIINGKYCPNSLNLAFSQEFNQKYHCDVALKTDVFSYLSAKDFYKQERFYLINEGKEVTKDVLNDILGVEYEI